MVSMEYLRPELTLEGPLPGDIIAFAGKQAISSLIQRYTRSNVSHVGIMIPAGRIIESTQLQGFQGVVIRSLSSALYHYAGNAWWLPLSSESRDRMGPYGFHMQNWLQDQEGRAYDVKQAMSAGADKLDRLVERLPRWIRNRYVFRAQEDLSKLFCSELAAQALEIGHVIEPVNASEVTPIDLCRFTYRGRWIYGPRYFQIKRGDGHTDQEIDLGPIPA